MEPTHEHEAWRQIPGYEGLYDVSDQGNIRSIGRKVLRKRAGRRDHYITIPERILKGTPVKRGGYLAVQLSRGGIESFHLIHHLVLTVFIGPMPPGDAHTRHLNDEPTDNRLVNLRWGDRSENMRDAVRNGGHANASKTHCKWGHEFNAVNTRQTARQRVCLPCKRNSRRPAKAG